MEEKKPDKKATGKPLTVLEKLGLIQRQLNVPRSRVNDFLKSKYRSCEDIIEAVKPILDFVGAVITMNDEIVQVGDRYYVRATVTLHSGAESISVSGYAREPLSKKGVDESQITGAASSYARKYTLGGLLALDDGGDPDSLPPDDKAQPKEPKNPAPKPAEILNQAFFEYEMEHDEYIQNGDGKLAFDKDRFAKAVVKKFKTLPTRTESIKKIVTEIKPEEVVIRVEDKETKDEF